MSKTKKIITTEDIENGRTNNNYCIYEQIPYYKEFYLNSANSLDFICTNLEKIENGVINFNDALNRINKYGENFFNILEKDLSKYYLNLFGEISQKNVMKPVVLGTLPQKNLIISNFIPNTIYEKNINFLLKPVEKYCQSYQVPFVDYYSEEDGEIENGKAISRIREKDFASFNIKIFISFCIIVYSIFNLQYWIKDSIKKISTKECCLLSQQRPDEAERRSYCEHIDRYSWILHIKTENNDINLQDLINSLVEFMNELNEDTKYFNFSSKIIFEYGCFRTLTYHDNIFSIVWDKLKILLMAYDKDTLTTKCKICNTPFLYDSTQKKREICDTCLDEKKNLNNNSKKSYHKKIELHSKLKNLYSNYPLKDTLKIEDKEKIDFLVSLKSNNDIKSQCNIKILEQYIKILSI